MKKLLLLLLTFTISFWVAGQNIESIRLADSSLLEPVSTNIDNLTIFEDSDPLCITLKYDITSFIRHKMKSEYINAEFRLHLTETDSIIKNIRLKARGNFRKGHCFFPPIYLNFKTDPIENTELGGYRKMKLVTHCSQSKSYENYIFREYLVYKLYNLFTDKSFRVKLLNIKYIDTGKRNHNYEQIGFLIEPLELLIDRTNSVEINSDFVKSGNIIEDEMDVVALFHYMIANTDWRAKGGHNMKYIKSLTEMTTRITPVPYDFDYSGFVNTNYAMPQEWTSINSITEREYLGYCRNNKEAYLRAIECFAQKKDSVYETIESFTHLNEKDKKRLVRFIDEFYWLVERPNVLMSIIERECRDITF